MQDVRKKKRVIWKEKQKEKKSSLGGKTERKKECSGRKNRETTLPKGILVWFSLLTLWFSIKIVPLVGSQPGPHLQSASYLICAQSGVPVV